MLGESNRARRRALCSGGSTWALALQPLQPPPPSPQHSNSSPLTSFAPRFITHGPNFTLTLIGNPPSPPPPDPTGLC